MPRPPAGDILKCSLHCRIREQGNGQAEELEDSKRLLPLSSVELKVGVLHYDPGQEPFPLLSQPTEYEPDTIDITEKTELTYWVKILSGQIPIVAEKAIATDGGTEGRQCPPQQGPALHMPD